MKCTVLREINCNHKRKRKQVKNIYKINNTRKSIQLNRNEQNHKQRQQPHHKIVLCVVKRRQLRINKVNQRQPITRRKIENCEIEQYLTNLDVHFKWISCVNFSISSDIYAR